MKGAGKLENLTLQTLYVDELPVGLFQAGLRIWIRMIGSIGVECRAKISIYYTLIYYYWIKFTKKICCPNSEHYMFEEKN